MNSDDYRDESGLVYVGADIVIALAVFAAAVLGALAAFGLVELARRLA